MTQSPSDVVLVLPGGGYRVHAPHEAEPIVEWLGVQGWPAKIVDHPLNTAHPAPLRALSRAVAKERASGARRVGVIGFSAGGHLAGLSTLAPGLEPDERPDFAILGYPVVSMIDAPHTKSRAVLLGDDADPSDDAVARSLSLETLVRPDSPSMFVWHTAEDDVVPVRHSTRGRREGTSSATACRRAASVSSGCGMSGVSSMACNVVIKNTRSGSLALIIEV